MKHGPSNRSKQIAIYSYSIRELFVQNGERGTGGAEIQLLTLARRLKSRGYTLTFLVGDFGQHQVEYFEDFKFIRVFSRANRDVFRKLWYLYRALRCSHADVILERGSSELTLWLSLYSLIFRRKFIFSGASDVNFARRAKDPSLVPRGSKILFNLGLLLCSSIIVQKKSQQSLVQKDFGRTSTVISSFLVPQEVARSGGIEYDVIWIANIIPYKQPKIIIELAGRLPELRFLIIGGARNQIYYEQIKMLAISKTNIHFAGFVPAENIGGFIARSKILTNTTVVDNEFEEGFPNTFLQAWSLGVPVVSLRSNPDGILDEFGIGRCSGSVDRMVNDIRELALNEKLRALMGAAARAYVTKQHDNAAIEAQYIDVIES